MLTRVLHSLVARPRVYDAVQAAAGAGLVRARLRALAPMLAKGGVVLDIGAGTGLYRDVWPADCRYVCLDLDAMKLAGFRARHADAAVQGDATQLPFADGCADAIACTLMSHHLTDAQLAAMMDEVKRVLKPAGTFLFADPLWAPARLPGRLLWRYDRGAHPRDANTLRDVIAARLRIERWEEFALWHRYAVCLARGSDL